LSKCEIKKVTGSRDDRKERAVVRERVVANGRVVSPLSKDRVTVKGKLGGQCEIKKVTDGMTKRKE